MDKTSNNILIICISLVTASIAVYKTFIDPTKIDMEDVKDASLAIFTGFGITAFYTLSQIFQKGSIEFKKIFQVGIVTISLSIVLVIIYLMLPTIFAYLLGVPNV